MMDYEIYCGDNLAILSTDMIPDNSLDACITDPPYGMGMEHWDNSVPPVELWEQVLRVLKPGGFCLSFCSPELYHRMAVNVDDAGFDIKPGIHPIVPIMLGDAKLAQEMAGDLLDEGIYVIGFSYPVVPKDGARIRVQISAAHNRDHLKQAIHAFKKIENSRISQKATEL